MSQAVILAFSVIVLVPVVLTAFIPAADFLASRRLKLTGWGSEATLEVRMGAGGVLLLAPVIHFVEPPAGASREAAYRLDPDTLTVTPVSEEVWEKAPGEIWQCDSAGLPSGQRVEIEGGALHIDGRHTSTTGRVQDVRISPDGQLAAALSARGVSIPSFSLLLTMGKSGVLGWHYHQLFAVASGKPIGQRISLGFGVSDPLPCWSPDGRILLYANPEFSDVTFVVVAGLRDSGG